MQRLEKNPTLIFSGFLIVVAIAASLSNDPSGVIGIAGLFLGAAGFANSLWLNRRINRTQDALCSKNITTLEDF